jgi:hypothetical protein
MRLAEIQQRQNFFFLSLKVSGALEQGGQLR